MPIICKNNASYLVLFGLFGSDNGAGCRRCVVRSCDVFTAAVAVATVRRGSVDFSGASGTHKKCHADSQQDDFHFRLHNFIIKERQKYEKNGIFAAV